MSKRKPRSTIFPYTTLFRSYEAKEEVQDALPFTKVRKSKKYIPSGCGHIFKVKIDGELKEQSLCGIPKYEISAIKDRKSTRLNSSHSQISYAVFCLKKKKKK